MMALRISNRNQMKKAMKKVVSGIALSLIVIFSLTGCEKDAQVLLTDGIWTFQSMTTDSEDNTVISLVGLGAVLMTGATMEFQEGGTYLMDSPLVENPSVGDWQMIGDSQLILDPEGEELASTSKIETITKDKLSYSETLVDQQLVSYKVTTTWTR